MFKRWTAGLALAMGMGILASGCGAPATATGKVDDRELSKYLTGYFDTWDADSGFSGISMLYMASYKWSCEEIKAAYAAGTDLTTDDPAEIVDYLSFFPWAWSTADFEFKPVSGTGTYKAFQVSSLQDYLELVDGGSYMFAGAGYANNADTVDVYYAAENGSMTLEEVDLAKKVTGTFTFSISTGASIEGEFALELCDVDDQSDLE